jgi:hypothetical protein
MLALRVSPASPMSAECNAALYLSADYTLRQYYRRYVPCAVSPIVKELAYFILKY